MLKPWHEIEVGTVGIYITPLGEKQVKKLDSRTMLISKSRVGGVHHWDDEQRVLQYPVEFPNLVYIQV